MLSICFHDTPGHQVMEGVVNKYISEVADVVIFVVTPKTKVATWKRIEQKVRGLKDEQKVIVFLNKIDMFRT